MYSITQRAYIAWKWVLSFRKRRWTIDDYPVWCRPNGQPPSPGEEWLAQILNWVGPAGVGQTQEAARRVLSKSLESARLHRTSMPRPGSSVPLQFAATERVDAHGDLLAHFIVKILGFKLDDPVFISDESSLTDFGDERYVATLMDKIREVYGVDVADADGGRICAILEKIQKDGEPGATDNPDDAQRIREDH